MKNFLLANQKWVLALVLALGLSFSQAQPAKAQLDLWGDELTGTNNIGLNSFTDLGLCNRDPRRIAASIIQIVLGFLGVIAVCLILFGGFKWMTAAGDDGKVEEAQDLIKAGVIGLLIILAAFSISVFVINALIKGTGGSGDMIQQN